MHLEDTDPKLRDLQFEAYRRMTGEERVRLAFEMSEQARQVTIAGIRSRNPEFDDREVMAELVRILHGDLVGDRVDAPAGS